MLAAGALASALKLTDPELLVPGLVTLALTPVGSPATDNVTFPVKFVRATLMVTCCDPPPAVRLTPPLVLSATEGGAEIFNVTEMGTSAPVDVVQAFGVITTLPV